MLLRNVLVHVEAQPLPTSGTPTRTRRPCPLSPHRAPGDRQCGEADRRVQRFVSNHPDTIRHRNTLQPFPIPGDAAGVATAEHSSTRPREHESSPVRLAISTSTSCTTAGNERRHAARVPDEPAGSQTPDNTVVWTEWTPGGGLDVASASGAIGTTPIDYDVDTDNDGIPDARYMDFGFPLMQDSNGNQFVALGAMKIIDADSLFNLNVHGNRAGTGADSRAEQFCRGTAARHPAFLSQSDHGVSASEVNPRMGAQCAADRRQRPTSRDRGRSHRRLAAVRRSFPARGERNESRRTTSTSTPPCTYGAVSYELANMEMWNLLNGRPQLAAGTPPTVSGSSFVGRWGENITRLDPQVAAILGGGTLQRGSRQSRVPNDPFPLPGTSGVDDNNNALEGGTSSTNRTSFTRPSCSRSISSRPAVGSPGTQGKQRLLYPGADRRRTVAGTNSSRSIRSSCPDRQWADLDGVDPVAAMGQRRLFAVLASDAHSP